MKVDPWLSSWRLINRSVHDGEKPSVMGQLPLEDRRAALNNGMELAQSVIAALLALLGALVRDTASGTCIKRYSNWFVVSNT